jgi:hypothetical protein
MNCISLLSTSLSALALAGAPLAQQVVFDDFNRPDSTSMGPDWTEQNGNFEIQSNQGRGVNPDANDTWMSHNSFSQTYTNAKARVEFSPPPVGYAGGVGLVIGLDTSSWSGVAILLQDNNFNGQFERIFFNAAINAGAWFVGGSPVVHDLPTEISSGEITAWVQDGGDVAVLRVEDASGNLIGVYTASGIVGSPFAPTGAGNVSAGVWVRHTPFFDDFYALEHRALDAYPPAVSMSAGGEQTLGSARAGDIYLVLGSATGTGPFPVDAELLPLTFDAYLLLTITKANTPPYGNTFGTLDSIGHARARITIPSGSDVTNPGLVGQTLNHAAIAFDPVSFTASAVTNDTQLTLAP